MATILVATYMIRYPMGGFLSYQLQLLVGLRRLGHDVYLVERATSAGECWDPVARQMGDDATVGMRVVNDLLAAHGLAGRWAFVDRLGRCHGLGQRRLDALLGGADLLLDVGAHGSWNEIARGVGATALLDGEPGWTQMRWSSALARHAPVPRFDAYFTVGRNVGTTASVPTLGLEWRPTYYPLVVDMLPLAPPPPTGRYTTVMNWQAHDPIVHEGQEYGQKDREFARFERLPRSVDVPLQVAVAGRAPRERLRRHGWSVVDAHRVTATLADYWRYVAGSRGEFSVAKHVFVATGSGWLSERSALYLGMGRPVVVQDTGLGGHLPLACGLLTFADAAEAADALVEVERDHARHARSARELAIEHLDYTRVLPGLLSQVGV